MPNPAFTIPHSAKFQTWDLNSSADGNDVDDEIDFKVANDNALEAAMQAVNNGIPFTNFVEFLSSQSWAIPADIYKIFVEMAGGGGGGAGGGQTGGVYFSGGGGGGGEIRAGLFSVVPSVLLGVNIAAGGGGGAPFAAGGSGGFTSITGAAAMSAGGGQGGQSNIYAVGGGVGVGAGGHVLNTPRGHVGLTPNTAPIVCGGGRGGGIGGGKSNSGNGSGQAGVYGGGGQGGGVNGGLPTAYSGGAGGAGYIRIWY